MEQGVNGPDESPAIAGTEPTVEGEVRARLTEELGGLRGSLETAFPLAVFTVAYLFTEDVVPAVAVAVCAAVLAFGVRLVQRSQTRFVGHGLVGIVVAAAVATFTGRAEAAFLPGMVQSGIWTVVLGGSILVGWPLAGFVVGAVLEDQTGWREQPAVRRLSTKLTAVLLVPNVIRLGVQVPLYLAGDVGWLGVSRLVLGWPLYAATLAVAGIILLRGQTPLVRDRTRPDTGADRGLDESV